MDISNKIPPVQRTPYAKAPAKTAPTTAPGSVAKGDQVALSDKAHELQAARETVKKMDDVDHAKVDRIKAQVEAGTYKIDADKIAGKMIEESLLKEI